MTESPETQPGAFDAESAGKPYARDTEKANRLLQKASDKAADHRGRLGKLRDQVSDLILLGVAWSKGWYKPSWKTIAIALGGLAYFVNPLDLVPDFIPFVGFLDDAAVIAAACRSIDKELDAFRDWREGHPEFREYDSPQAS